MAELRVGLLDPATMRALREAAEAPWLKEMQRMAQTARAAHESFRKSLRSPALEALQAIQAQQRSEYQKMQELARAFANDMNSWRSASSLMSEAIESMRQPVLCAAMERISEIARLVESPPFLKQMEDYRLSLAAMDSVPKFEDFAAVLGDKTQISRTVGDIAAGFLTLRQGHTSVMEAYAEMKLDPVSASHPLVADYGLPEIDVSLSVRTVDAFEDADDDDAQEATGSFSELNEIALARIDAVVPRHVEKLRSALKEINRDDPQSSSNACTAVRQAIFGTLNKIAPEDDVRQWAIQQKDPKLFLKEEMGGTPTRYGRILYLSRFDLAMHSRYTDFIEKNARALVALIDLVSTEVHDEEPDVPKLVLTPRRVELIVTRGLAALQELIICWKMQLN